MLVLHCHCDSIVERIDVRHLEKGFTNQAFGGQIPDELTDRRLGIEVDSSQLSLLLNI